MNAPLTTCAVMLAMRPVPPSSPNAVPRTCEREGGRRVKGGRREGVETPNRPLRRAAHRRVEGLSGEAVEHGPASRGARVREECERDDRGLPECREWTPGKVTAGRSDGRTESAFWAPRAPLSQPGAFGGYTVGRTVTAITPCSPFPLPGDRLSRLLVLVRYRLWLEHGGDNCRIHQQVCGLRQGAHDLQPPFYWDFLQFCCPG